MIRRPNLVRSLMTAAALAAAFALAGCKTEGVFPSNARANAPIPTALLAEMEKKDMAKESPILVRLFKEEAELEVWKQDRTGRYSLLKTYPICRWSGDLGPKVKEGDRQAPEGFYNITPGQMNPNSQYFLAFNLGYPNAYDRAHDRTGAHLMVHGDCSSRGCYAMSDEQISEIFAMGRESFFAGQQSFQVQAYPFRMTAPNMAKHRNSPHFAFWKMIKRGSDNFEVTRMEPKVDVCDRRYVFNAQTPDSPFNPKGKCPAFEVPKDVVDAVNEKQRRDELQIAELTARNTPTAPSSSNRDGGMHPKFLAALRPQEMVDDKGKIRLIVENPTPGKLASVAYSPTDSDLRSPAAIEPEPVVVADVPLPRVAPQKQDGTKPDEPSFAQKMENFFRPAPKPAAETRVATAEPAAQPVPQPAKNNGSLFSRVTAPKPKPAATEETVAEAPKKEGVTAKVSRMIGLRGADKDDAAKEQSATAQTAPGGIRKIDTNSRTAQQNAPATTATTGSLMNGAQPIPPSSSFDNRFSAFR